MSSARTRLVLYALLSATEKDLRNAISDFILPHVPFEKALGADIVAQLIDRCGRDGGDTTDHSLLLDYSNLADALHAISRNTEFLGEKGRKHFKSISSRLNSLIPVRNRVMHTRPLQFDDYVLTFETDLRPVSSSKLR